MRLAYCMRIRSTVCVNAQLPACASRLAGVLLGVYRAHLVACSANWLWIECGLTRCCVRRFAKNGAENRTQQDSYLFDLPQRFDCAQVFAAIVFQHFQFAQGNLGRFVFIWKTASSVFDSQKQCTLFSCRKSQTGNDLQVFMPRTQ